MEENSRYTLGEFEKIVRELRGKCPWDSVQTHESLRTCLESESREVMEGITILSESGDGDNLCEELGDLLMQIVLHSVIAQEEGLFTLDDVISRVAFKMKYRHPKIFAPEDEEAVRLSWEELKRHEYNLWENQKKTQKLP